MRSKSSIKALKARIAGAGVAVIALVTVTALSMGVSAPAPQPMGITIDVTPIIDTVQPGETATYNVSVTSIAGESEYVNFTIEPERPGWSYRFDPEGFYLEPGETNYSILSITTAGFAPDGDYFHNITANAWVDYLPFPIENSTYHNLRTTVRTPMVTTHATVLPLYLPPEVLYKWEKPDDTPGDGYTNVYPVPGENKTVSTYVVVYDPNGKGDIASVIVRTFYPLANGSACGCVPCNESNCCEPGACVLKSISLAEPLPSQEACEAAKWDAYREGLLTLDQVEEIDALIANGTAWIYRENTTFNCSDPAGIYTVCAQAFDNASLYNCTVNTFEYVSVVALRIDFSEVNYGAIRPNETKWTSPGSVMNDGNDPMDVVIEAWNMTSPGPGGGIIPADQLDAAILVQPPVEHWLALPPGVTFDVDIPGCGSAPINFSLHVPLGTPPGDYSGYIRLTGKHG